MRKSLFLFSCFMLAFTALHANKGVLTPQNIFDLRSVSEAVMSPNNEYIAFTLNVPRPFTHEAGGDYRELYLFDVDKDEAIPLFTDNQNISNIGWHPSGKMVTFRANLPDQPGMQVYAIGLEGGKPYPLTKYPGNINSYEFIDNETLAFVSDETNDPKEVELRLRGFKIDIYEEEYRHLNLYTYNTDTHQVKQLTSGKTVFDFVLSPDKKMAAAAIAPRNLVDDSYMFKRIHLVDMTTGETTMIMDNPGKLGKMAWSPDGSKLAFQASSMLEDAVAGSLFVTDINTKPSFEETPNLVEGMELSVIDLAWKDNQTLLYAAEEGVDIVLSEITLGRPGRKILIGPGMVCFSRFNINNELLAFAGNTAQHPGELFRFDLSTASLKKLTDHNPWLKDVQLGKQLKLEYNARDGMDIEGVLVYPVDYDASKTYPLIVYIHGGPEAAVQNGWNTSYNNWGQVAAARGYFVFMPNYRASSGRGVEFTMAGYGDLVGVEYEDVLDGIDHLIDIGYVDRERVGMGGGSYGGYFSAWSATRYSERFAAAVVFVGISNQVSKRNTTDIPWEDYHVHWGYWTKDNLEDVYSRSPVKYVSNSETPTLILHGYDDPRVHPSQSLELYRGLKMHGNAPVRLIWYKGEGHGNRVNVHRLDYIVRTMEWFDHYLRLDKSRDDMPDMYPDYGVY